MKRPLRRIILLAPLLVALALSSCRDEPTPRATTSIASPTAAAPAATPANTTTATTPADPATAAVPTAGASGTDMPAATGEAPPTGVDPVALPVPDPGLFDLGWQQRELFEVGLVDGDDAHRAALEGASVYHMDLQLSSDATMLAGNQEVFYTNQEDVELHEIYLRLFPNLADGRTTIHGVWINGQEVAPTFELRDSAMRLPLQPALAAGESVVIKIDFEVEIPSEGGGNYGTFVFNRDILALAHFYPMIAVYDDEGWNLEIAPESGDVVYADSSFYLVRLSAPAGMQLAASGVEIEGGGDGERQLVTYAAGPARDFYIAGSAGFAVYSQQVGDTVVNSYAFPELEPRARDVLQWSVAALQTFNEQVGPYPYRELDVVTTPTLALGVEYPGIIAINMDLYDPQESRYPPVVLESTVAHEVAHQWFYAVIGNDQLDDPWLDESLTQYATYLYFADTGSPGDANGFRQSLVQRWQAVDGAEIPIGQPVAAYEGAEYSAIVYGRGPLFFETLAMEMGEDAFDAFLRDYYATFKWDIATPLSLQALAEEHCACDLDTLFDAWVFGE